MEVEAELDAGTAFDVLLDEVRQFWTPLPDKPEETSERLLSALWRTACGAPASVDRALRDGLPALDAAGAARLRELLELKKSGVPLAHLTQKQSFLGLELLAGPGALIPRKETQILGRAALAKLNCLAQARGALTIIDVCTGSGNLALAYAHYQPGARIHASDLCQSAVDLARRNLEHLDPQSSVRGRVEFRQGDLLKPFDNALLKNAPRFLKPESWLGFEVGLGQGALTARQLEKNPAFSAVETYADESGEICAIFARSRAASGI